VARFCSRPQRRRCFAISAVRLSWQLSYSLPISLLGVVPYNRAPNVSPANLPARLVKSNGNVKRASYMNPKRIAMRATKRAGTPPRTHSQHDLTATGRDIGGAQTAENQIAKCKMPPDISRVGGFRLE